MAGFWLGGVSLADNFAKIGDVEYTTVAEAISHVADGGTITLIGNTTETAFTVAADKNFILDLNWKTLTLNNGESYDHIYGSLVIRDTATAGKIVVRDYWIMPRAWWTLTIENWIFDTQTYSADYMFYLWWGTLHIIDWTFNGYYNIINTYADWNYALWWTVIIDSWTFVTTENDGWNTTIMWYENSNITINGWEFTMNAANWEYAFYVWIGSLNAWVNANSAVATINGWKFNWPILAEDGAELTIAWWKFSEQPDSSYIEDWYVSRWISESPYLYEVVPTYTITWNFKTAAWANTGDTTVVNHGDTPTHWDPASYTDSAAHRIYEFASWDPALAAATADAAYTATYTEWACVEWYTVISWSCVNKQTVACVAPSSTVENATYATTTEITYSGSSRTEAWECTFTCKAWYKLSNGQCVKKSSSWWSSSSSNKTWDTNTWNVTTWTNNTWTVETWTVETWTNNDEETVNPTDPQAVQENGFTKEFNDAYEFAFANGITTMKSIEEAAMEDWLTRIAMAKMLSQYAINVLKKTPDTSKECKFGDVSAELDAQYDHGVTLACQLGIMWVWITDFRPFDPVVRAEFGTALSRLLFGLADGEEAYYTTHLAKLKEAWIIKNDDPTLEELRGYVMLMLMRSANK